MYISPQFLNIKKKKKDKRRGSRFGHWDPLPGCLWPLLHFSLRTRCSEVWSEHKLLPFVLESFSLARLNCILATHKCSLCKDNIQPDIHKSQQYYTNGFRASTRQVNNFNFSLFRLKAYLA